MATINIDPAETFWTPLAVVAQLAWWFGYSGPHHFTCTTCNARIEIRENGSFYHACAGTGWGGSVLVGTPWEPFDPFDFHEKK